MLVWTVVVPNAVRRQVQARDLSSVYQQPVDGPDSHSDSRHSQSTLLNFVCIDTWKSNADNVVRRQDRLTLHVPQKLNQGSSDIVENASDSYPVKTHRVVAFEKYKQE